MKKIILTGVLAMAVLLTGIPTGGALQIQAAVEDMVISTISQGYTIQFENTKGEAGICIASPEGVIVFENQYPAELGVADASLENESVLKSGYTSVAHKGNVWTGKAEIRSGSGSIFQVEDSYTPYADGVQMKRCVSVIEASAQDGGYASYVSVESVNEIGGTYHDYEYFIPAIIYKDSENITGNAAFSEKNFYGEEVLVKETRTGLPMVMMRQKSTGHTLSMAHVAEDISDKASDAVVRQKTRCDALCRYGSVGMMNREGVAAAFRYPYLEAPNSYTTGKGRNVCYHPVQKGAKQQYALNLFVTDTQDYNQAMIACYKQQYEAADIAVSEMDMQEVYQTVMEDVGSYVGRRGKGIGLPFAAYVDDGSIFIDGSGNEAFNFQMGFIGMQIPLAYQMMRCGQQNEDYEMIQKGIDIMNFWCNNCGTDSGVVKVWYDTNGFRPYPPFLRIMTDGMEGMLDACQIMEGSGEDSANVDDWKLMVLDYADFLVEKQNKDGSYYRAYDYDGNAFSNSNKNGLIGDANTYGESKLNSAVPIRFLVRMYEWTGDERYLNAAKKAGSYVLDNLYQQGKYVGGTADNPNTVDKEAGMYAVYAYSALYGATQDERYLRAMEQAAVYSMSWVYTYKFSAANPRGILAGIPTTLGMNDGLSFIATGHSGVDNMIAYLYYELFKLYVWTGEDVYYDMSCFIQNNTKQTMDLDGKYGYAKRSFQIEATGLADLVFGTAGDRGIWLPWISCANAEPISQMEDTFGTGDVSLAKSAGRDALLESLSSYGAGGRRH